VPRVSSFELRGHIHLPRVLPSVGRQSKTLTDNRVTQLPPLRTHEADHEATSRSPADNGRNRTRGEPPQNPNHARASAGGPPQSGNNTGALAAVAPWWLMVTPAGEAAAAAAPHTKLAGEPVAEAIAEAEATVDGENPST
jgi:hypothetical protein